MINSLRGVSPSSEAMSDSTLERNRAEKALILKTPTHIQIFSNKNNIKNYSDKNGNNVTKTVGKGRKTFAFWTLVVLLFVLAIGNLILTFTILAVLRLGQDTLSTLEIIEVGKRNCKGCGTELRKGLAEKEREKWDGKGKWASGTLIHRMEHGMESMEFVPELKAIKFFGNTYLEHIYKRDGLIESFSDVPMSITSDNGSVLFNLQTRLSRSDTKLVVNSSGVFIKGVHALELVDPESGELVFSTASPEINIPDGVNNLQAKQVSTKRVSSPVDQDLTLRTEASAYLRGAEGTHMESKELFWTADQDIHLKSVNGSVVLSGKDGVYIDVRYLPIALPINRTDKSPTGQFKVCVCMPLGKLFKIAVPTGQKVTCSHVNMTGDLNPCV